MLQFIIWSTIGILCIIIVLWLDHNNGSKCTKFRLISGLVIGSIGGPIFIPLLIYLKQDIIDTWRNV